MGERLDLEAAARLVRPRDTIACGLAAGQPAGLLVSDVERPTALAELAHPDFRDELRAPRQEST